jgi:hypothetical protein
MGIQRGGAYSLLSPTDQWAIHNYYMPTIELSDQELREHRISATTIDPTLPQRAGRAHGKLKRGERSKIDYAVMPNGRTIAIRSVVRPQPNLKLLMRACLEMAKRDLEERSGNGDR